MSQNNDQHKFKIIIAGDGAVGKTTLINRYVTGSFTDDYKATIGVAIFSKYVELLDTNDVYLQIWDIAGQPMFRTFRSRFFASSRGALLVYDLTIPQTLDSLHNWINDITQVAGDIPMILIGNKCDLTQMIAISDEEVKDFLTQHPNVTEHYFTSALTGNNVEQAFSRLASQLT